MIMLSIDPALHGAGIAVWRDGELFAAEYVPNDSDSINTMQRCVDLAEEVDARLYALNIKPVDLFVCEIPQIYPRGANKTKGDPNKIVIPLAMVNAAVAARLVVQVVTYQPHSWKGTTSKPKNTKSGEYVITTRVKSRLSEKELQAVDWTKSVSHSWDVADAIGVGLVHLGRFERIRVFARE